MLMPRRSENLEFPATPAQQLGTEIRHWREELGLSAEQLGRAVGKDRRTITGAEAGRDFPSEAIINLIESRLGSGGLILSYYEAVLAEKRRLRLNAGSSPLSSSAAPDGSDLDSSTFIEESVPDGTLMKPGQRFEKTWTIQNAGSLEWRDRFLYRVGIPAGPGLLTTPAKIAIPIVMPGERVIIAVPCVAHLVQGTSRAVFKMADNLGCQYFPNRYSIGLQVQVTVVT
jgi:transcriptional regulator with XRE-family HTH domain